MPRLFVGIDFPVKVKYLLSELCTGISQARCVEPEKFYRTLPFIGTVDDATTSQIANALERVEASAFPVTLVGVGHFREHTVCVDVERNSDLISPQAKIECAVQQIGLPTELRSFTPHVKLARLKRRTGLRAFLREHVSYRIEPFDVGGFCLIESQRIDDRTVYKHRTDYPLCLHDLKPSSSRLSEEVK